MLMVNNPPRDSLPWQVMFSVICGMMRYPPECFWQMTFREYWAVVNGGCGEYPMDGGAPSKEDIARLMIRFPDRARP